MQQFPSKRRWTVREDTLRWLRSKKACQEGLIEVLQYQTIEEWWAATKRGEWMLWLAARDPLLMQGNEKHRALMVAVCLIWWELAYPWWHDFSLEHKDTRPQQAMEFLWDVAAGAPPADAVEAAGAAWAAGAAQA